jgi:membrane protein required for colicin V production
MFESVSWLDLVIIGLVGISTIVGFIRGFIREALSLVVWIVAIWAGVTFSDEIALMLNPMIESMVFARGAAFGGVFLLVLMVGSIVNHLVFQVIKSTGLSGTDRLVGFIFGFLRGAIIISVGLLGGKIMQYEKQKWWKEAQSVQYFMPLTNWIEQFIPKDFMKVKEIKDFNRTDESSAEEKNNK